MDVKFGILILLKMALLKNWSLHPVPQLEEIRYMGHLGESNLIRVSQFCPDGLVRFNSYHEHCVHNVSVTELLPSNSPLGGRKSLALETARNQRQH